jgi:uncharacterized protein YkwD
VFLLALALAPGASARGHAVDHELTIPRPPAAAGRAQRSHGAPRRHGSRGPHSSHPSHASNPGLLSRLGHHAEHPHKAALPKPRPPKPVPHVASRTATPAPSNASVIATVLATPCQNTELVPSAANLAQVRTAVLCLINTERAQRGELPLNADPRLEAAAESHVNDMIATNYFEHVSPNGTTPVDRVRAAGYLPNESVGYVIGENLAWGTYKLSTAQAIVSAWIASPGHLANILESSYRDTGIAIIAQVPASVSGGSPGATYAQEFGVISE